jgi:hypothetical protein
MLKMSGNIGITRLRRLLVNLIYSYYNLQLYSVYSRRAVVVSADLGRVPIVSREDHRVVGLVERKDLLRIRSVVKAQEQGRIAYSTRLRTVAPQA